MSFPDIWRQILTLSVSARYWSRWTLEKGHQNLFLPAVLDSGDLSGIMPMEFPLLNLLTAPCFSLGPYLGRSLSIFLYEILTFGLVLLNAGVWKNKKILGIESSPAMVLLPIFSLGVYWSTKYMPDFLSVLFVVLSMGLSWEKNRPLASLVTASLGLLMKPTAVILFFLMIAHPKRWRKALELSCWWIPALGIAFAYYTQGIAFIAQYQDMTSAVGVRPRSLTGGFNELFKNLPFISTFYYERAFFWGGLVLVLLSSLWSFYTKKTSFPWILWFISILQFVVLAVLDGGNLFYDHYYYLLVLVPVFCLLFVDALAKCESRILYMGLILGLLVPIVEVSLIDLKTLYWKPKELIWSMDVQVRELQKRNPSVPWRQGQPFRSSQEPFPFLGLHFGEIQGSKKAKFGFFYREDPFPSECRLLDQTPLVRLVSCSSF